MAETALSEGASDHSLRRIASRLACANASGDDEDGDDGDDDHLSSRHVDKSRIMCSPMGANPVSLSRQAAAQFEISSSVPNIVATLRIYDAAGRLVAEPLRNAPVAGRLEVRWNGVDRRGNVVPPGTYFYRATTDGARSSGRFVLMH